MRRYIFFLTINKKELTKRENKNDPNNRTLIKVLRISKIMDKSFTEEKSSI